MTTATTTALPDTDDCCPVCGEHFSDPHGPGCPNTPAVDDEEDRAQQARLHAQYEQRAARYWVGAERARAEGDTGHAAELEDLAGQCQQWAIEALTASTAD